MLIYIVPNNVAELYDYVCDSQATIDARPKNEQGQYIIPADQCSVGGEPEASAMLTSNQQAWLTQQAALFTVDLQTTVSGGVNWTVVDLTTQPPNDDYEYFLLNPITGSYTEAIGLNAANSLFAQIQQEYLVFTNIAVYTSETNW
jgi:hypothetical protein